METALLAQHQALTAKLVDFSGWNMPLHYGSQVEEHHSVRQRAGLFDVSHMGVVDFSGADTVHFLRSVCANDVAKINDGQAIYTCLLNQTGGVIDDLIVYRITDSHYRLVLNAGRRQQDMDWLTTQQRPFHHLNISPQLDHCIIAIQGPQARQLIAPYLGENILSLKPFRFAYQNNCLIARTGYTGEDGVEVILPAEQARSLWRHCIDIGIQPCGLGARDTLRLEAGLNLYGHDMDEQTSPIAANLSWTVCLKDPARDFIGKTAYLSAIDNEPHCMIGVVMQERGVLRDQQIMISDQGQHGIITSGGFSPTLGHAIGFARITKIARTQPFYIERRGKQIPLQTVKLPFVKKGQANF